MASKVEICNLALYSIGQKAISALDEGSAESIACDTFYGQSRDEVLSEWQWSFAQKRQYLAALTNDQEQWAYKYQLPSDILKPIEIVRPVSYPELGAVPYVIEGEALYCDIDDAQIKYVYRLDDPVKYPAYFVRALASKLGADIVMALTQDMEKKQIAEQVYLSHLAISRATDGNAQPFDTNSRTPGWIGARA